MKFALIHNERICQFVATQKECFPVAAELSWVSVADDVTDRDTLVAGKVVKFIEPAPRVTLAATKTDRVAAMLSQHGLTLADLKAELAK